MYSKPKHADRVQYQNQPLSTGLLEVVAGTPDATPQAVPMVLAVTSVVPICLYGALGGYMVLILGPGTR